MSLKDQRWFSPDDVYTLLSVCYVKTDTGLLWSHDQAFKWCQAAGKQKEGALRVERTVLASAFPEVFERLGMHVNECGAKQLPRMYVLELLEVGVRFGMSIDLANRFATQIKAARQLKREVGRIWVSEQHEMAYEAYRLIKTAHDGHEYLHGHEFHDTVARVLSVNGALAPGLLVAHDQIGAL